MDTHGGELVPKSTILHCGNRHQALQQRQWTEDYVWLKENSHCCRDKTLWGLWANLQNISEGSTYTLWTVKLQHHPLISWGEAGRGNGTADDGHNKFVVTVQLLTAQRINGPLQHGGKLKSAHNCVHVWFWQTCKSICPFNWLPTMTFWKAEKVFQMYKGMFPADCYQRNSKYR